MVVKANGATKLADVDTAQGAFVTSTFNVTVTNGSLEVEFSDAGGSDPTWIVNHMTVAPATQPPPAGCDRAQFISDVTVPDGTTFAPGATFTKTWRLKNSGTCTWTLRTAWSSNRVRKWLARTASTCPSRWRRARRRRDCKPDRAEFCGHVSGILEIRQCERSPVRVGLGWHQGLVGRNQSLRTHSHAWHAHPTTTPWLAPPTTSRPMLARPSGPRTRAVALSRLRWRLERIRAEAHQSAARERVVDSRPALLTFPQNTYNGYVLASIHPTA